MGEAVGTTLARIAASGDPLPERALALLECLRSAVDFDAAWLAFFDAGGRHYVPLTSLDLDDDIAAFFSGPVGAQDIAVIANEQSRRPVSRSDLSRRSQRLSIWSDCLVPAGIRESLSVALHAPGGRHVGFLMLMFRSASPPLRATRRRFAALAPAIAPGVDPMPRLLATARVVRRVTAGTVLRSDGGTEALPGLDSGLLLSAGSPVLDLARERIDDGLRYSSFLWPLGAGLAPGHARVTVVAAPADVPPVLTGMVLASTVKTLHGLTPRELEVLGLVVEGCSNQEIAQTLVVAPRTVAAHVEHLLTKLDARTRTTAAVRAEREGLYVPPVPDSS